MATGNKLKLSPFWLITILILFVLGGVLLFSDVITGRQAPPEREPEPPSPQWTTAPESGVEVELPETPLRVVPREESTPDEEATGEAQ